MNGERSVLRNYTQSYVPRVRVEIYFPVSDKPAYQYYRRWLIEELTQLHGGCSVQEDLGGYYFSQDRKLIEDRISVIYSDFDMDWSQPDERAKVVDYCVRLKQFLLHNLSEEEFLITAHPISHVSR
jgi:hypothetical protein